MKQTKIICTLGPSSQDYDTILRMAQAGMNIVRLNFSHGTHEEHKERIDLVRKVEKENGVNLGIMLDTKGPEIRLGTFKNNVETYKKGEIVTKGAETDANINVPGKITDNYTLPY